MNTTPKTTKRDFYATLLDLIAEAKGANLGSYDYDVLEESVNKEIAGLDKRAEQAKARAAKAKADGDALRDTVYGVLTDQPQTIAEILAAVVAQTGDSTLSAQKITTRLSQLADEAVGKAVRCEVSIKATEGGKSRTLAAYKRA